MVPAEDGSPECAAQLQQLRSWVSERTGAPPTERLADEAETQVLVYPVGLQPAPGTGPPARVVNTAEVRLRVLICAVGEDVGRRSCLSADLALHVLASGHWQVTDRGPDPLLWQALGLPPRPGLLLDIPVRRVLDRPGAPPVREPLHVGSAALLRLSGRVVAPDGTPVSAAVVTVLPAGPRVNADHRGHFGVTAGVVPGLRARLDVRGRTCDVPLDPAADGAVGDLVHEGLADLIDRSTSAAPPAQEV